MDKTRYVAGFLFNKAHTCVALIEKQKPAWQKSLLNGIGGKIESGETPLEAMVREFKEETGVLVEDWQLFCTLRGLTDLGAWWVVYFFRASGSLSELRSQTDEIINICPIAELEKLPVIPNLRWLVPMAKDGAMLAEVMI